MWGLKRPLELTNGIKPLACLTDAQLLNVLEQERLVADAIRIQRMLAAALNGTMKQLATELNLPAAFELDRETGEVFAKKLPGVAQ